MEQASFLQKKARLNNRLNDLTIIIQNSEQGLEQVKAKAQERGQVSCSSGLQKRTSIGGSMDWAIVSLPEDQSSETNIVSHLST